jgi:3-oxoacyl-[acyl-carrier protein] reductase
MDGLTDEVALVTGGGHGIGEAIVKALAGRGARVVVNDVVAERAEAVAATIAESGGEAVGVPADVSVADDVERLVVSAVAAFGRVDILVNNAAAFCNKAFLDHSVEDWDRVFSVNARGAFLCCRAVLPAMIERRHGNIVNIASIAALRNTIDHVAYAASKAAIVALTRDVASEVAGFGVRVNAVSPGPIDSKGQRSDPQAGVLVGRAGKPADIASAVAYLVSDASSYIVGQTISVAGGSDLKAYRMSADTPLG